MLEKNMWQNNNYSLSGSAVSRIVFTICICIRLWLFGVKSATEINAR